MDIKGDSSWFSRFGKALSMRHRELNLMRFNFLGTCLRNLDESGYLYPPFLRHRKNWNN